MKKSMITKSSLSLLLFLEYSIPAIAGTPQLNLDCKSTSSPNMIISGYPRGEGYDLKIKMENATLSYIDKCKDPNCSNHEKQGNLFVVEALNKKVFTLYFVVNVDGVGDVFMGQFYALPDSVKYTQTPHGYRAQYKAIYDGADPRSKSDPKAYLSHPIELSCSQQEEL
ncbi:hypothetical protein [Legionella maioricensis]|uniref:Secreted protein n=1 Tax=Legionella maioricensis TaxID=2896528 RepID=A0A9X2CZQ1_9GAMM|nr:hypothetical protein [Legionella maioricensis]MCL9683701.1 hypothetical protein [Legionella maioricensis]MCL9687475.1 hypothetical protein [Legionella maioricensis]